MIDLHFHVLPGIDDGPRTVDEALELVATAAAAGTRTLVATPHVNWQYPNHADLIARLVDEVNGRLSRAGVALEIRAGAEIAMTRVSDIRPRELSRMTLGGGRWLLLEPPFQPVIAGIDAIVADLQRRGFGVVLAHPERCQAFHRDRATLERLVNFGVLTSVTAGSLDGRFGATVRRFSLDLVRDGLVHNVASDAHDRLRRPPSIGPELERAGLGSLTSWLTHAVPAAILGGGKIPQRPATQARTTEHPRWRRRLLGRS